jgi:hypothetical protein
MGELVDQWTGGRVGWGEANKIGRVDKWARGKQVAVQKWKGERGLRPRVDWWTSGLVGWEGQIRVGVWTRGLVGWEEVKMSGRGEAGGYFCFIIWEMIWVARSRALATSSGDS